MTTYTKCNNKTRRLLFAVKNDRAKKIIVIIYKEMYVYIRTNFGCGRCGESEYVGHWGPAKTVLGHDFGFIVCSGVQAADVVGHAVSVLFAGNSWKDDIVPFVPHAVVGVDWAAGEFLETLKIDGSDLNAARLAGIAQMTAERKPGGGVVKTIWTKRRKPDSERPINRARTSGRFILVMTGGTPHSIFIIGREETLVPALPRDPRVKYRTVARDGEREKNGE